MFLKGYFCIIILVLYQETKLAPSVWTGQHGVILRERVRAFSLLQTFQTDSGAQATYSAGNEDKAIEGVRINRPIYCRF
jgi:hypothetical protein